MSDEVTTQDDNNPSRMQRVKQHLKENKKTYLVGAGAGIVGTLGGLYFRRPIVIDFKPVIENVVAPVFNNHNHGNHLESTVNNAGHLHKIVRWIRPDGTSALFESVNEAARAVAQEYGIKDGSALDRVSKVANGHIPDYKENVFEFVGVGTR